jgi:predicted ATPase
MNYDKRNKQLKARPYLQSVTLLRDEISDFKEYPFSLPIVRNLTKISFHSDVTFFVGDNGSGKSTLIEAIALLLKFNPEGGSKNFSFTTEASYSQLYHFLRPSKSYKMPKDGYFLRAESFYNVASNINALDREPAGGPPIINSYGGVSLHNQSHGESFWSLLTKRFGGHGIYILDEPEAALSPGRQMAMLARMHALVKQESQFIIATHSPILLAYPNAVIYELQDEKLRVTPYEETEHYKVTRRFIGDYKKQLEVLLNDK